MSAGTLCAERLRTADLVEPLGIDVARPRLTWTCAGGIAQTAYRVLARRGDLVVWDTGRVEGAEMAVRWGGPSLGSRDRVAWSVTLWDQDGREGPASSSWFEMGLLRARDWTARWITGDYGPSRRTRRPVDCFRTSVALDDDVSGARLYITARGLYEARINGHRVGDAVMTPGFTDYATRLHAQTYDVGGMLHPGQNAIEISLADGWFRGSVGAMGARHVYGDETGVLAQLEIRGADGAVRTVGTDGSWRWSCDGPIREADMKDGEVVDLHLVPGYGGRARETVAPVVPTASNTVPVREKERFAPVVSRTPSGAQLLDFGQNIAGYVELAVRAHAGDRIRMRFAERLDEAGELDLASIQVRAGKPGATPQQRIELTLAEGENRYKTSFAVFGFRYAEVTGDLDLRPEEVTAIAVYSDMAETGRFDSSHPLVNRFVENTRWSMKGNFLDVPTDCPTRERAPWTGDVQIFARTGSYLMNTAAFFRKWLQDLRDAQGPDGKVPCHAPSVKNNAYLFGIDLIARMDGSAGWADAAVLVPLRTWELFRDDQILRDAYASMTAHVEFQISRTGRTGLFGRPFPAPDREYVCNVGQAFGEWLEPVEVYRQRMPWDFIAPHPEEATAYLANACAIMAEVARHLGHDDDVPRFERYRDGCRAAYARQFPPEPTDRQSVLVRPLAFGLYEGDTALRAFDLLVAAIERREHRIGTGFLSTPLILPVLSRGGRTDVAYRMLENEQSPGWLHEVLEGATTVWEDWEGAASHNHYSPGSMCQWLFETVCGVDVVGERRFRIAPEPGGTLSHASFAYDSAFGTVASAWRIDGDGIRYDISVPANTTAEVRLPGGLVETVGPGRHAFTEPRP